LVFIPPKSAQVNFVWGKNDIRTAIQHLYPQKTFIPPKQISGYAPGMCLPVADPGFAKGGDHGERAEREPKWGFGGGAPSGVEGQSPWWGVRRASP